MIQMVYAGLLGVVCTVGLMASEAAQNPRSLLERRPKRPALSCLAWPGSQSKGGERPRISPPTSKLRASLFSSPRAVMGFLFGMSSGESQESSPFSPKRRCIDTFAPPSSLITLPEEFAIKDLEFHVGPQSDVKDATLQRKKITHVISITAPGEEPVMFSDTLAVLPLQFADDDSANLEAPIQAAYKFIEAARGQGPSQVLVHCHAGQSRSVAILLSYLLQKQWEKPREDSETPITPYLERLLKEVQKSRPCAGPRLHFMGTLVELETRLRLRK